MGGVCRVGPDDANSPFKGAQAGTPEVYLGQMPVGWERVVETLVLMLLVVTAVIVIVVVEVTVKAREAMALLPSEPGRQQ